MKQFLIPSFVSFLAKNTLCITLVLIGLLVRDASAQFGAKMPSGPNFHGANAKIFGDNSSFSAVMQMIAKDGKDDIVVPGRMAFSEGLTRFEMDIGEIQGKKGREAQEAKSMGMDKMISITRPDKKVTYTVWPGFKSYVENPIIETGGASDSNDYKVEVTSLGKETVDGHPCEKNRMTITGKSGDKHESTVWNATDLKNFPIRIETMQDGQTMRMQFKEVQLGKPAADLFEPPAGFKRYDNMQNMMMTEMMKREGQAAEAEAVQEKTKEKEKDGKKIKEIFKKRVLPF